MASGVCLSDGLLVLYEAFRISHNAIIEAITYLAGESKAHVRELPHRAGGFLG